MVARYRVKHAGQNLLALLPDGTVLARWDDRELRLGVQGDPSTGKAEVAPHCRAWWLSGIRGASRQWPAALILPLLGVATALFVQGELGLVSAIFFWFLSPIIVLAIYGSVRGTSHWLLLLDDALVLGDSREFRIVPWSQLKAFVVGGADIRGSFQIGFQITLKNGTVIKLQGGTVAFTPRAELMKRVADQFAAFVPAELQNDRIAVQLRR